MNCSSIQVITKLLLSPVSQSCEKFPVQFFVLRSTSSHYSAQLRDADIEFYRLMCLYKAMCYLPLSRSPVSTGQTWFHLPTEQCAVMLCEEPFPGTGHSTKPSGQWNIPREHNKGGMSATGTISVTISHRAVMWFISPQGSPSGVSTGHRKPQDSGSSLRTVVVLIWENAAPLWMQRKWER